MKNVMRQNVVNFLLKFHRKNNSLAYKVFSLIAGAVFFLAILPGMFIFPGLFLKEYLPINVGDIIEYTVAVIGIVTGLFYLIWSTLTQWRIGNGTPAPNAPTERLIIVGPYKYCRNPIEFGAMLYYLGVGVLAGGIIVGITCCILGFIVGSAYHKFIEEKELEARFGEEYRKYKQITPFVFPFLKVNNDSPDKL
ncbi:MAG: isoprenylcysteine carboxylmethyltransferase family protein [Tannerellaceae bacterium]|jgi:protein-S-isoprenylcysteine O-methyltransferase Ste14|nr:isoprenylcysteine carboxylmethyltransferase family protein [Tannerellaceae bacterium]